MHGGYFGVLVEKRNKKVTTYVFGTSHETKKIDGMETKKKKRHAGTSTRAETFLLIYRRLQWNKSSMEHKHTWEPGIGSCYTDAGQG